MRDFLKNQFENIFLWAPFLMAFGAALYFGLDVEPMLPFAPLLALVILVPCLLRRTPNTLRAVCLFVFGFLYAAAFTKIFATPQIFRTMRDIEISGRVHAIDFGPEKSRIYIDAENLNPNPVGKMIVRLSVSNDAPEISVGDTIRANGSLFRPAGAYAPGTFDFARWAYFNGLTATGYASDIEITSNANAGTLTTMRSYLHKLVDSFLADGLVFGYKQSVPESDSDIWIASGIGHVWSISGFHMTLVSGWLFAIFYLILRCIPFITRRVPARIPAMILALGGLVLYLFLSGTNIATIRAFIMTALVFAAFILGRNAISMRNICMAFLAVFLLNPHCVMQAGFQLSFSAVFGLVWFWGTIKPKMPENKILKIIYSAVATSLVATIFTLPFVAVHFYAMPLYGLLGNLVLLPIFSFVIMPLVMIGIVLATIGIRFPIDIAHTAYDLTLILANKIAELPFASLQMPHISNTAMIIIIIGFVCLILVRANRIRTNIAIFCAFEMIGLIFIALTPRPVFFASPDHKLVAFRDDNKLEFNKSRASNHFFAFDTWKQISGVTTDTPNVRRKHNKGLYVFHTKNFSLAYIQKFVPLHKNISKLCQDDRINYIVSYFDVRSPQCDNKILRGGVLVYPSGYVKQIMHLRPWHNPRQ